MLNGLRENNADASLPYDSITEKFQKCGSCQIGLLINFVYERISVMNKIISCEFNIDTACVEVKLIDGSMVSVDCIAVENEYANNMYEISMLDYLIYNDPLGYVKLLLSGKIEEFLRDSTDYTPLSDLR